MPAADLNARAMALLKEAYRRRAGEDFPCRCADCAEFWGRVRELLAEEQANG